MTPTLGYNPINLARYILAKQGSISNMKLQKLLFYTESVFMAVTNKSLFEEKFEAWRHGPVLPVVYHTFKKYSALRSKIPYTVESTDLALDLPENYVNLIDQVIEIFGRHDGDVLRNNSHKEEPYKIARIGIPEGASSNVKMDKTEVKKYYRDKLSRAKNPELKAIHHQIKQDIMLNISEKYKDAWIELAK